MEKVLVFTTWDSFQADLAQAALNSAGIPSIRKTLGAGVYFSLSHGRTKSQEIQIFVSPQDKTGAADVLASAGLI